MVKTIGNPLSWTAGAIEGAASHIGHSVDRIGSHQTADDIRIRRLDMTDIRGALRSGLDDFAAARADVLFLVVLYPIIGLCLVGLGLHRNLIPMLFPLAAGFALIGPLAAVGLYEISRRRELGEPANWGAALNLIWRPRFGAIVILGLYLIVLFLLWMIAANAIYQTTIGPMGPHTAAAFVSDLFLTGAGWTMIILGTAVGAIFAFLVLVTSVVSFPLLLDRAVGLPVAVVTSFRVFQRNPGVILAWGGVVALGLFLGALPAFIGLVIALPILGHATWHLYRRAVR